MSGDPLRSTSKVSPIRPGADISLRQFMSVKEVADYLHINTKKVYALVSEGKIPGTKVTGKWLFPRKLVDRWLMESSHGGLLTDRLVVTGSDDALIQRAITHIVNEMQGHALVSYTNTGTELGLSLLARQRADVCGVRWGPAQESARRHTALVRQYPPHKTWVLVRAFEREQGLVVVPGLINDPEDISRLFGNEARWVMRHDSAGAQRYLRELFSRHKIDPTRLRVAARVLSERDIASYLNREEADVGPGPRSLANEFGLDFIPVGWEAYDLALDRGVFFRTLFQKLIEQLKGPECQRLAAVFSGYRFDHCGEIVWSA